MSIESNLFQAYDSIHIDSSFIHADTNKLKSTKFESFIHQDPIKNISSNSMENHQADWLSGFFLIAIALLAFTNFAYTKRFRQIIQAFTGRNYANQLMREGNLYKDQISIFLFLVYLISLPAFYLITIRNFFPEYHLELNLRYFIYSLGIILGFWVIKLIIIKSTAIIFNTQKASFEIHTHLLIYNLIAGMILLPSIIIFYYSGITFFLYLNICIWSSVQILRFFRFFSVGLSYSIFSNLHLFLYLCTLEIIPFILLVKLLLIKLG